ncbi:universal stress protein UspE [soil metagenome]
MERIKRIAVGIDYSPASADALKQAVRMAAGGEAEVMALHVFEEGVVHDLQQQVQIEEEPLLDGARRRLADFIHARVGESPVSAEVVIGHPFEALLQFVERGAADFLMLGVRGQEHPNRATGELAVKCVRKAPLPVMLVPEGGSGAYRTVVACIDFSEMSAVVARTAVEMARADGAAVRFVHVYRPLGLILGSMEQYMPAYPLLPEDEMVAGMLRELDAFVAGLDVDLGGVDYETTILDALNVGGAIHDFVKEKEDCLVVLGTVGRTGMKRFLMGTTAEKVVRGTPCAILALKPEGFRFSVG